MENKSEAYELTVDEKAWMAHVIAQANMLRARADGMIDGAMQLLCASKGLQGAWRLENGILIPAN